jgi:hypothetical protein
MTVMDLSAIIRAVMEIGPDSPNRTAPSLRPGEMLTGKVIELSRDGQVLMDFGRFRARAQFDRAVQPGQSIPLEVVESGTALKLRVRDAVHPSAKPPLPALDIRRAISTADHRRLQVLMDRLVKPADTSMGKRPLPHHILDALGQLKTALQPMPLHSEGNMDQIVGRLKLALGGSGLFFEKAMAEGETGADRSVSQPGKTSGQRSRPVMATDLKAHLLQLKAFFSGQEGHAQAPADLSVRELSFLKNCLEQLLTHVQDQQGRMVSRLGDNEPMLAVTHHLYVEDQRQPVKLRIYYPQKGRKGQGEGPDRLAMLLNMDRLGPVRIDMVQFGKNLEVGFFVHSETVRQRVASALHRVREALENVYDRVRIVTRISEQKIAQFDREPSPGSGSKRIDIQI